jgi:hypothetical protein
MALSHNPSLVTEGLIIYLDANNTSSYAGTGTTWYDLSGNGRHASLISSPSYEGFGGGKYLSFDGSTNFATIPYTITDNLITVGFWYYSKVFSSNASLDALISNYTSGISGFDVRLNSSTTINLAISFSGSETGVSFGTIANNTWYYVVFTYDGATIKTYLDGVLKNSTNRVGTRDNGTQICIGTSAYDTNRRATCGIPQVMIYNRALSDAEMLQNYNATKGRYIVNENIIRNGLVLHFDANNPNSYAGTGLTVTGLTGYTGSLIGGVGFSSTGGQSFFFDGNDDLINTNYSVNGMMEFTAEVAFKTTSTYDTSEYYNNPPMCGTAQGAGYSGDWCIGVKAGYLIAYDELNGTSNNINLNIYVADNNWYFAQATRDSSGVIKYYVNGNFITQSTGRNTLLRTTSIDSTQYGTNWMVGSAFWTDGRYRNFLGNIGINRLYNRALTAQEIKQNYNATKNRYGL